MRFFQLACLSASWLLIAELVLAQAPGAADQAKARWKDGTAALARGDTERARAAFKEAYDLLPDAELAQGLGEIEFRTGHFADAARHLTKALENRQLSTTRIAGGLMKAPRGGLRGMKRARLSACLMKGAEAPRMEAAPGAFLLPPAP